MSIDNLKKLRELTGVSFSLCKRALDQSGDDIDKAKKLLAGWGAEQIQGKLTRKTTAGAVFSYIHHNKKVGVLLELLCETDFVASNQEFQRLGADLTMQIASMNPKDENELLQKEYIKDPKITVQTMLKEHIFRIGENIKIGRFIRYEI